MEKWRETFQRWRKNPLFVHFSLVGLAAVLTVILQFSLGKNAPLPQSPEVKEASADTYIPAGYVLVPIEIQNLSALDSILGQQGMVDLFLPPNEQRKKPVLIKRRTKVLRAPHNPGQFAALVREEEAAQLLWANDPLFAVVQNPAARNAVKAVEQKLQRRRIIFHDQKEPRN